MLFRAFPFIALIGIVLSASAAELEGISIHYRKERISLECVERSVDDRESCARYRFVAFRGSERKPKDLRAISREFAASALKRERGFAGRVESGALDPSPLHSLAFERNPMNMTVPGPVGAHGLYIAVTVRRDCAQDVVLRGAKAADSYAFPDYVVDPVEGRTLETNTVRSLLVGDPLRLARIAARAGAIFDRRDEFAWNFGDSDSSDPNYTVELESAGPIVVKVRRKAMQPSDFENLVRSLSTF
jgi:hypothetical protein